MIAIRLYAFDGVIFTMAWMPTDSRVQVCQHCVQAAEPKESFTVVPDGFVVNKLFDPTGHAPHSPNIAPRARFRVATGDAPDQHALGHHSGHLTFVVWKAFPPGALLVDSRACFGASSERSG
jgi:hypothetical protein